MQSGVPVADLEKDIFVVAKGCICCCCCKQEHGEEEEKHGEEEKQRERKCTDIACLLLLIVMVIGDIAIFAAAFAQNANPEHLWKGHDYNGNICGDEQRTAWLNISYPKITQCVSSCEAVDAYNWQVFEHYWCVPDDATRKKHPFPFDNASATYTRTVADLHTLWQLVLVVATCGSIIISLIYLYMISINRRLAAYIVMNILFGLFAGILLIIHGTKDLNNDLTDYTGIIEIVFGSFILALVLLITAWFRSYRNSLQTDVEMMAEAIETIHALWSILLFCAIYALFIYAFFVYWVVCALFIYSVPDPKHETIPSELIMSGAMPMADNDNGTYVVFSTSDYKYLLIYHMIFALYILFVFCYFAYLISAYIILVWYVFDKKKKKTFPQFRKICQAVGTVAWYHIGTASFAALSLFFCSDIYPICKYGKKKICKNSKCCKKRPVHDNDDNDEKYDDQETLTTVQMVNKELKDKLDKELKGKELKVHDNDEKHDGNNDDKERKKRMYNDIKNEVFPLIEEKIRNMSIEYAISEAISRKMESIACRHYYIKPQKHGAPDTKNILHEIRGNITKFNYEKLIEEDIEALIDAKYEKLHKELEVKREIHGMAEDSKSHESDAQESRKPYGYNLDDMDPIRKEGLTFTALHGTHFRLSSYDASKLEKENITRLANVDAYNERFGRLGIATVNTAIIVISMFILDFEQDNISSFIMPASIVFLVSYTIAYIFTLILEVTVGTLLICVQLDIDEVQWNKNFAINEGKIKQNVTRLGNGLTAMLSEHLLIMELKERDVNEKITVEEVTKYVKNNIILKKHNMQNLDETQKRKKIWILRWMLRMTKKYALETERQLLETIDAPMKLTQYLIDVILVENYFNKQYKEIKPNQERARRKCEEIISNSKYSKSAKLIKKSLYDRVKDMNRITHFLDFYPIKFTDEQKWNDVVEKLKHTEIVQEWEDVIKKLEITLRRNGIKNFEMTGAKSKGIERAFYKSFYCYHKQDDGFRNLTDMLRCSFKFSDFENLYKCFAFMHNSMGKEFEILRVKDRFNSASEPCGYRDFMLNVLVVDNAIIEGIICEIQLHHKIFYDAKKISHKMYKRTRLFDTDDGNEAYNYAVKYIRPVIGRFKVYPIGEEEEEVKELNVLKIIEKKIEKLGDEYYKEHIKPKLDKEYIIEYDKSVLAVGDGRTSIILP